MRHLRLLGSALAKFNRDEGFFLASAIAYQALLCLVPFALLLLSFAGSYLLSSESAVAYFGQSIEQAAPVLDPALRENLMEIVAHRGTSGIVGTVGLLWMATAVFSGLRYALNAIFGKARPHGTLRGLAVDLGMIALAAATFIVSFGLTGAIEYLRRVQTRLLPAAPGILLQLSLSYVVPVLLAVVLCFQIYPPAAEPPGLHPLGPPGRHLHRRPLGGRQAPLQVVRPRLLELLARLRLAQRGRGAPRLDLVLRGGAAARRGGGRAPRAGAGARAAGSQP